MKTISLSTGEVVIGKGVNWLKRITSTSGLHQSQLIDQAVRDSTLLETNQWLKSLSNTSANTTERYERVIQISRQIQKKKVVLI